MRNRRYGDNDRHLWPFTLSGRSSYRRLGIMLDSGAYEGSPGDCHIMVYAFGWTLICELPRIIKDYRERRFPKWDAETVKRMGRDWYDEVFPREYGFSYVERALHVHFGAQTHSSMTDQNKCFFLPWLTWRHVRHSLYDAKGNHFWTAPERYGDIAWEARQAVEDACPTVKFDFEDYDGKRITATTRIEEREWRLGEKPFRWLSWFRRPKIVRSLNLEFSAEVGPEKGSWKGGTTGHSIEMLPGEMHEAAFKRYCQQEHRSKYRRFQLRYAGSSTVHSPEVRG